MTGLQWRDLYTRENLSKQKAVPVLQLNRVVFLMETEAVRIGIHPQLCSAKLYFIVKMESE
jgi:hypothetical protein